MKKLLAILLAVLLLCTMITLAGCGNMSIGYGNFEFQKVHVDTYHHDRCFTVERWLDSETGVEVKTKEAGTLFLSEGTYILLDGDHMCPFCESTK